MAGLIYTRYGQASKTEPGWLGLPYSVLLNTPITPLPFTLVLHSAALQSRPSMRRPFPFLQPRPFILHTPSLHSRPLLRRLPPPPFTVPPCTLHSAALHPSLCHPSLPPLTVPAFTVHSAASHPSLPHHSLPAFSPPPFTPAFTTPPFTPSLHCRPSLRRPSLFILPLFAVQSATLHPPRPPSLGRPSLPRSLATICVTAE
jgi:hypothetical protein